MRKPEIDHDHMLGRHAVRGFICHRCNLILGRQERGLRPMDDTTLAYLRDPFHALIPAVLPGYRPPTFNGNDAAQQRLAARVFRRATVVQAREAREVTRSADADSQE